MGKSIADAVLDAALNHIKTNGTKITVCSAEPTDYTEAVTTYMLVEHVMGSGDYTVGNGDTNGRKVAVAQQADVSVGSGGDATHVSIVDVPGSGLLLVTTCTLQNLTQGNTVTIPTFDYELADPT